MIDLHVHTNCSDGSDDVLELLKKAEQKNIEILSITDHDTCAAYEILKNINIKDYYTGKLIPGVELKTKVEGIGIELLGYYVDTDIINNAVKDMYIPISEKNKVEGKKICEVCKKIGIYLPDNIMETYDEKRDVYFTTHIHNEIIKNSKNRKYFMCDESWESSMAFYRLEISNPKSLFYIDFTKELPEINDVIKLIRKAGGLVFVPHIFSYKDYSQRIFEYINKNCDIDGYECYHSKFTEENSKFLIDYCKKNNLFMSGGTDYHGKIKPDVQLLIGKGNMKIEKELVQNWIK